MAAAYGLPASRRTRQTSGGHRTMRVTDIAFCEAVLSIDEGKIMNLGNVSVSLAVKDIEQSKAFYEKLGFKVFGGNASQNWLILKNGDHVIGLFQGMFERNTLTFSPGWDSNARQLDSFADGNPIIVDQHV